MKRVWVPILALMLLAPAAAQAGRVDLSDAPVIRKPLEWRKGRFGVAPVVGSIVNDPYWDSLLVGVTAEYHILDWLGIGLDFRYNVGFTGSLLERVEKDLAAARGVGDEPSEGDVIRTSHLQFFETANVQFTPIYGKFLLAESLEMAVDLHLLVGAGHARTTRLPEDAIVRGGSDSHDGLAIVAGIGARVFVIDWLALNFEVRDYLVDMPARAVPEYPAGSDRTATTDDSSFKHNIAVSLGFTFFFPTEIGNSDE